MLSKQFARFCVIGAVGFAVDGGLMVFISSVTGLNAMQARPFSFAAAVTVTWWLNRRFTFSAAGGPIVGEWARYAAVNGLGALLNLLVFYLVMLVFPSLRTEPLFVLAIASAVALAFNFAVSKRLVFRGGTRQNSVNAAPGVAGLDKEALRSETTAGMAQRRM